MSKNTIRNFEFYDDYAEVSTPLLLADLDDLVLVLSNKSLVEWQTSNSPEKRQFYKIYSEISRRLSKAENNQN